MTRRPDSTQRVLVSHTGCSWVCWLHACECSHHRLTSLPAYSHNGEADVLYYVSTLRRVSAIIHNWIWFVEKSMKSCTSTL